MLRLRIGVAAVRADPIYLDLYLGFLLSCPTGISTILLRYLIGSNNYFFDFDLDLPLDLLLDLLLDLFFLVWILGFITTSFKSIVKYSLITTPLK